MSFNLITVSDFLKHHSINDIYDEDESLTILMVAYRECRKDIVLYLLKMEDLDINFVNIYGHTALTYATSTYYNHRIYQSNIQRKCIKAMMKHKKIEFLDCLSYIKKICCDIYPTKFNIRFYDFCIRAFQEWKLQKRTIFLHFV